MYSFFSVILLLFCVFLLGGCTSAPVEESANVDRPPGALLGGAQFYEEASQFDAFLHGKLPEKDAETLKNACKSQSNNPFCPSIKRIKQFIQIRDSKVGAKPVLGIKPIVPISPEWKKGKIKNWVALRKGSIQPLIKGLLAAESKEIHFLTKLALKETRCPNNIAVALAATMEDLLPNHAYVSQISELYQKGATCSRRDPVDKEHFLTRAALLYLYDKQPKKAKALLEKIRPTDAFSGRALYWLYRTKLQLEDAQGSSRAFHKLTTQHPFSFHALLALKSIGQDPGSIFLEKRDVFVSRSTKDQKINQFLYQIELLNAHKLMDSAAILVDWVIEQKGVESGVRLYAASLGDSRAKVIAGSEFMYRRSSFLTRPTMELLFPKPHFSLFEESSSGQAPALLGLAIARKESMFNPKAVSIANAQGLLQLNPDTSARLMNGRSHDLFDPKTNIQLGMQYVEELMKRFNGSIPLVLASYNAGEDAVGIWTKRFPGIEPVLWIDLIPYRETRDYVGFVLANYFWYRRIYGSENEVPNLI